MSVINIIRQTHAIHVITDGLTSGPDGRKSIIDKAIPLPALNAVVAVRGAGANPCFLAACIAQCMSRSDIETKAVNVLRELVRAMPRIAGFEVYIAGWDDAGKFNYGVSSTDGVILGGSAWTMIALPTDNTITSAPFQNEWLPEFRKVVPKVHADKMNVNDVAIELVKLQRRMMEGGSDCIGGLVSKNTITKKGIAAQIIKR